MSKPDCQPIIAGLRVQSVVMSDSDQIDRENTLRQRMLRGVLSATGILIIAMVLYAVAYR